jgi:hypothetical protein
VCSGAQRGVVQGAVLHGGIAVGHVGPPGLTVIEVASG